MQLADETARIGEESLRVGGATAAIAAGCTELQLKAIGGWCSVAFMRYVRSLAAAMRGASKRSCGASDVGAAAAAARDR